MVMEEDEEGIDEDRVKKLEHIKGLVMEFCGDNGNNLSSLERWLTELDVGWVLHLANDGAASAGSSILISQQQLQRLTGSWILALYKINKYVSRCFHAWYRQEEVITATICPPAYYEFVGFIKAIFSRMLPFRDTIVSLNISDPSCEKHVVGALGKLQALIDVRDALSTASEQTLLSFHSSPYAVQSTHREMRDLLSAEPGKLDQAIWETMDEIKSAVVMSLADDNDSSWDTQTPDIHKITRSVIKYIKVLCISYRSVNPIVCEAISQGKYVPVCGHANPLTNLIMEMVCCLQDKLSRKSQSFRDHSVRFLFLINNSYFISRQIQRSWVLEVPMPDLTGKLNHYIRSYLQVSWAPVLKCLQNPATLCFARQRQSPLAKFESRFQETYTAQKLWKVPDPEMRKRLRKAIIRRVYSGYTKFLEDSGIYSLRVPPKELKKMLEELFEG
ncbi:hypothetical protein BAE44_0010381 [Dichanthelium oligosanthes]|uniref:Exocyst subunit Exo70 family protein n=1 Tax=Dichanthelium oligosanthes TaxID=888268 RepID=A0A1E5VU08_9POAL|nr:hypothetical protein BAE44_0010381 [Dichanthelium oligosanthes]